MNVSSFGRVLLTASVFLCATGISGENPAPVPEPAKEITTLRGETGELLKKWYAEGTASGNTGDIYDNRDREHSGLDMKLFPQLKKFEYSKEELDKRQDWAFFGGVRPGIVFGNSSTSAGAYQGGSNPRQGYVHPKGLEILQKQYTSNNLYIYPEHRDHDHGRNGANDGYGDLYPTNTPFLLISQGSSGSDQPFMRAVPLMLAALRPEVKKKLAENGQLMPTVQMLLRYTNKHLTDAENEYPTGKAHPTVFEGSWVHDAALVKMAHAITLETLPPRVQLKVVEEDQPKDGLDFYEPGATEVHATLPDVVARIFRGKDQTRRIVVSAEDSRDPNGKALKYHWAVLRGDPKRITISPKNDAGSIAEIKVGYHERRAISDSSPLESNRVDIGVFVHNGTYYSAPAFVTYFFIDNEARTYADDGRILEIGYKSGETTLSIPDWTKFFALLDGETTSWPVKLLREELKNSLPVLIAAGKDYAPLLKAISDANDEHSKAQEVQNKANTELKEAENRQQDARTTAGATPTDAQKAALMAAEEEVSSATDARKRAEDARKVLEKKRDEAKRKSEAFLRESREGLPQPIQTRVEGVLQKWQKELDFIFTQHAHLDAFLSSPEGASRVKAYTQALEKLAELGILKAAERKETPQFLWLKEDKSKATLFERAMIERCNGEIIAQVLFPGVIRSEFKINYVQPEIAESPAWRDVYFYAPTGALQGWMRYGQGAPQFFNHDGWLSLGRDNLGRCTSARSVTYESEKIERDEIRKRGWPYWRKTIQSPGAEIRHYKYASDTDWVGTVERTEKADAGTTPAPAAK